ncbi:TetR/AcrR family transcriptional regulator [Nocardioides ultimimeridianus]
MARLTRAESQRHNRERLLGCARTLFLRDGYNATSLAAIADEAGFSTGVIYSNFVGKSELALLVLQEIQGEQLSVLRDAMRSDEPLSAKLDRVQDWAESAFTSGWPRLELEFALEARPDRALVAAEAERHEAATLLARGALEELVPPELADLVSLGAAAEALVSLAIGVAVRRLIDPSVRIDGLIDGLRHALRAFGLLGAPAPR